MGELLAIPLPLPYSLPPAPPPASRLAGTETFSLAGEDLSAQAAMQTKENAVANVAVGNGRGVPQLLAGAGEKEKSAISSEHAQSDAAAAVEISVSDMNKTGGKASFLPAPVALSAADELSDLRGQLRQLVESLRSGSSGLSLAQVKARVADLRGRIAAAEAV